MAPISPIVGAGLIGAGSQLASTIGGVLSNSSANAKNERFAWNQERLSNQRYWERLRDERAYLAPRNQSRLFREAGWNPSLAITGGQGVQSIGNSQSQTPSPAGRRPADYSGLASSGAQFADSMLTAARAKSELNSLRVQEATIKSQEAAATLNAVNAAKTDQERKQLLNLYDYQVRSAKASTVSAESDAYFRPMMNQSNLSHVNTTIDKLRSERVLTRQKISTERVQRAAVRAGINLNRALTSESYSRSEINSTTVYKIMLEAGAIEQGIDIREWEQSLREAGVNPNDSSQLGTLLRLAMGATNATYKAVGYDQDTHSDFINSRSDRYKPNQKHKR